MSAEGLPCRKCGQITANPVIIYGRDRTGTLVPRAAQCRGRCGTAPVRREPRPARPARRLVVTAIRPGKCSTCTWDIVPGDQIMHLGDSRFVHFECAPAEDVPLPGPDDDGQDQPGTGRPERRRRVRSA